MLGPVEGVVDALGALVGIPPGAIWAAAASDFVNNRLDGVINSSLPDHYGACGGMTYASLDYFYADWVIPKGKDNFKIHTTEFDVPKGEAGASKTLRDYIYRRHSDTFESGVLARTIEWWALLFLVPDALQGGAKELKARSQQEWPTLTAHIDAGKPWALALIVDDVDILNNHQLVAYGYEGGPAQGIGHVQVYDNRNPTEEVTLTFDFTGDELNGKHSHTASGAEVLEGNGQHRAPVKGFFCSNYKPVVPPVAVGLSAGLSSTNGTCKSYGESFDFAFAVKNVAFQDCSARHARGLVVLLASNVRSGRVRRLTSGFGGGKPVDEAARGDRGPHRERRARGRRRAPVREHARRI